MVKKIICPHCDSELDSIGTETICAMKWEFNKEEGRYLQSDEEDYHDEYDFCTQCGERLDLSEEENKLIGPEESRSSIPGT